MGQEVQPETLGLPCPSCRFKFLFKQQFLGHLGKPPRLSGPRSPHPHACYLMGAPDTLSELRSAPARRASSCESSLDLELESPTAGGGALDDAHTWEAARQPVLTPPAGRGQLCREPAPLPPPGASAPGSLGSTGTYAARGASSSAGPSQHTVLIKSSTIGAPCTE